MELPNEIIYSIYKWLNPKDQTRLSMVSKSTQDCFPNWLSDHKKLFAPCIDKINKIEYGMIAGNIDMVGIRLDFDEHIHYDYIRFEIFNYPRSISWRVYGKIIKIYYTETSTKYETGKVCFSDNLRTDIYLYDAQFDKISLLRKRDQFCILCMNRNYTRQINCNEP
ncbi:hypothetical protein PV-S19_0122 [Pacmanvirus S19]|nr:hypothetical protein PV-S19_0122 [Pacmanvirus S19]